MRVENADRQKELAVRLERLQKNDTFPVEGIPEFLDLLVAWLRGQDTLALEGKLKPQFREAYIKMLAALKRGETTNPGEEDD